jgi:hypothetical protein
MKKLLALAVVAGLLMVAACDTVTTGPTIKIVYPANGATIGFGGTTIKATATDDKGVTKVAFFDGSTAIGATAAGDTFSVSWAGGAAGSHTLKAVATNDDGKTAEHSITVTVSAGNATHHSGVIDTNEVWYPSGNPHILDDDVYTGDGVTLTIMPGCYVQASADVELYCGYANPGSIIAVGKADSVITFTALSDTVAGFWNGITFYANTISTAKMSYCNVLFGGKTSDNLGAVRVDGTNIKFDHNLVRKSGSNGVWVSYAGYFSDFTNNTITSCTKYAVHVGAANVPTLGAGNTLTGNTKNGIEVFHSAVTTSGTWLNHGVPYVVTDDVVIDQNAVLTISPGCTVAFDPQVEFYVGYSSPGGIIADGTAGQITFTSSVNPPSAGDWTGLSFYGNSINSQCKLINCKVEYAGYDNYGNIRIDNCTPTVTGCDIGYSSAWGIYLSGTEYPVPADLLANNTFHNNTGGDVRVPPKR